MDSQSCLVELNRSHFYLEILRDVATQMGGARSPMAVMDAVLLSAMGGLGASCGYAALGYGEKVEEATCRGGECAHRSFPESLAVWTARVQASPHPIVASLESGEGWPIPAHVAVGCPLGEGRWAALLLGPRLDGSRYADDESGLLYTLGVLLVVSLRFVLSQMREEMLAAKILQRNEELDRQVFHLLSQRELAVELSSERQPQSALARGLPLIMGHFGYGQGVAVLVDRRCGEVMATSRGGAAWEPDRKAADALLFACLSRCAVKQVPPRHVEIVDLEDAPDLGIGFIPSQGFLFQVREELWGVALFGESVGGRTPGQDSSLAACIQQWVLHLHSADAFATIMNLNADLEERNQQLARTVEELTQAQGRIARLESRVRQVLGALEDKAWQVSRARVWDFLGLLLVSAVLGFAFNGQNPHGVELLPPSLPSSVAVVHEVPAGAVVVDARPRAYFERGHFPGAVNIPPQFFDFVYPMLLGSEDVERRIVVYGDTWSRRYHVEVARLLVDRGHEAVAILDTMPQEMRP
jgi:rhodanese-related sulfurtransferase